MMICRHPLCLVTGLALLLLWIAPPASAQAPPAPAVAPPASAQSSPAPAVAPRASAQALARAGVPRDCAQVGLGLTPDRWMGILAAYVHRLGRGGALEGRLYMAESQTGLGHPPNATEWAVLWGGASRWRGLVWNATAGPSYVKGRRSSDERYQVVGAAGEAQATLGIGDGLGVGLAALADANSAHSWMAFALTVSAGFPERTAP